MSEAKPPLRRPVLGLVVIALLFGAVIGAVEIWQQARWLFADPLALAFKEHDLDKDGEVIHHATIRKFLTLEPAEADKLASEAGFDCKALTIATSLGICYRDVWTRLCKELWTLQLVFDQKKKISEATGRKRRVCLYQ